MPLRLRRELSPSRFAEIGKPAGAWRREDGDVVALASAISGLYWPGHHIDAGRRVQHRLSLYDGALKKRLGVFDGARFPINDVAFHPTEPIVALGTGSYDGGYRFEGDLWLWNWESDEVRSPLGECRDVAACRWVAAGRLAVLLRPRNDEEFPEENDAFTTYVGLVLDDLRNVRASETSEDPRLANLQAIDPARLGFERPPLHFRDHRPRFEQAMGTRDYEERSWVRDVMWLSPELVAATHDNCHIEVWNTRTCDRVQHICGDGFGVQLLEAGGASLLHVHQRRTIASASVPARAASTLFSLEASGLSHVRSFDHTVVFSADRAGNLVYRDATGRPEHSDVVPDARGESTACWVSMESFVRAATDDQGSKFIERRELGQHASRWRVMVDAPATSVVSNGRLVVFALTDGTLAKIDANTGDVTWSSILEIDGVGSFATALAIREDTLVVGSAEGRVLLFEIAPHAS
ncbi:MAG: PQQ-binding-like beta-propeller repeat protein [Myxococcota bacterium]